MVETIMWLFGYEKAKIIVNVGEKIFNRILTNMST